jgi:hypothetical protein
VNTGFWDTFHTSFRAKAFGQQCIWVVEWQGWLRWAIFFLVFMHYLNCPEISQ